MDPLCLEFMNSAWSDYRGTGRRMDRLEDPQWRAELTGSYGLDVHESPSASQFERLRDLRSALWKGVHELESGRPAPDDVAERLDRSLDRGAGYRRRLSDDRSELKVELDPIRRDWDWVESEIAASFVELLATHEPSRIKVCNNEDCRWVFIDTSKSRTRRWCADTCGNLLKVRKHRARARAAQPNTSEPDSEPAG